MKYTIYTVDLYEAIDAISSVLVDQCVSATEEMAIAFGEHHVELLEGKGWFEVKKETLQ